MAQSDSSGLRRMRAFAAPRPCKPSGYDIIDLPIPTITKPDQVLVRVHAAALTPSELRAADGGLLTYIGKPKFPIPFGMEGSGTVVEVGSGVTEFKPGDAVFGGNFNKPAVPLTAIGFCSEYVVLPQNRLFHKPDHLTFEGAAALFASTLAAYQSFKVGAQLSDGSDDIEKFLRGKSVFIPAGLGGTGSTGLQLAKNVYGASNVISTVSTGKVPLVGQNLPGIVDKVVNYQTESVAESLGSQSVDFVYQTLFSLVSSIPLLKPDSGVVVAIADVPPASILREVMGPDNVPFWVGWLAGAMQYYYRWKTRGTQVKVGFNSSGPWNDEDNREAAKIIASGKIKPVMTVISLNDLDNLREECEKIYAGKGGLGKLVIKII